MKNRLQKSLSLVFASVLVSIFLLSAVNAEEGKMPVTSSSEAALENYWKGISLTDKLRFPDARPFFEKVMPLTGP